jgi:excisionase family DNA binding protein
MGKVTYYEKLEGQKPSPTPTQFSQPYLTRLQVCDILQITLPTVHTWVKSGILKGYRLGNRVYFKKDEIDKALTAIPARGKGGVSC